MIRKVIAVAAIVIAGIAALLIVARPQLDPDLVLGYWQRDQTDTGAAGPALIRIDRDGGGYSIVGALSPSGEYVGINDEVTDTFDVDENGITLKSAVGAAMEGGISWTKVRVEPGDDGSTLRIAIVPWEEEGADAPIAGWSFTRADGDPDDLEAQLERQQQAVPSAAPSPAP